MTRYRVVAALVALASLAGCGGGRGDAPLLPNVAKGAREAVPASRFSTAAFDWTATLLDGMKPEKPAPPDTAMRVYAQVRMRDVRGLLRDAALASSPGSALYRQFLTPQEIAERYGATKSDYAAVARYFSSYGLRVVTYAQRQVVQVNGTAGQMSRAFHTPFAVYGGGDDTAVGPVRTPSFGRRLPIETVTGLVKKELVSGVGPIRGSVQNFAGYTYRQLAVGFDYSGAYAAGYDGSGVVTGVIAVGPYNPADPRTLHRTYDWRIAKIVTLVAPAASESPTSANEGGEAAIDSQTVAALAPGSTMQILFDDGDALGTIQFAVQKNSTDVLTYSADFTEYSAVANRYLNSSGTGIMQVALASLAREGIAFFNSSGDNGSTMYPCAFEDHKPNCVLYPASDPNVVSVGGLNVPLDDAGAIDGEITAWADNTTGGGPETVANHHACNCVGSTGGISSFVDAPSWQLSALGLAPGSPRQLPDLAMDADEKTGAAAVLNGSSFTTSGTSFASPMASAAWALVLNACKRSSKCATAQGAKPYRLGVPSPLLYKIYAGKASLPYARVFYQVVHGNNTTVFVTQPPVTPVGYSAKLGYNNVTGLGMPFVGALVNAVVPGAGAL